MKLLKMSFLRKVLKDEQGQSLVLVTVSMLAFLGVSGISMDLGHAYIARQELQASTNSAALCGATYVSYGDSTDASAAVTQCSALPGSLNESPSLTNVQLATPAFRCLATVTALGTDCVGAGTAYPSGFNSMVVTQSADVKTWFAKMFGVPIFHITATAYASPGSEPQPLNMAVIIDTTSSMAATISSGTAQATADPQCVGKSELACALNGIGILLNSLPSPANAPVALFAFPNVTASSAAYDINCGGTPSELANSTPTLSTSYGPTGSNPTYEIVPFSTDYTNINKAVGTVNKTTNAQITNGCTKTPSGAPAGTYLAGAIVAAQSALVAQQVVHPVAVGQNVMVILTDGNVNGSDQYKNVDSSLKMMGSTFSVSASSPPADVPITGTSVTYPSGVGGCGQAVQEAQAARASTLQTSIFVLAYGSPTVGNWNPTNLTVNSTNMVNIINNSNCPSDQDAFFVTFKSTAHGTLPTSNNVSYVKNITPCATAQGLATPNKAATQYAGAITYFYSDTQGAASGACPSAAAVGSMASIFKAIAGSLPRPPRLIPNGSL